MGLFSYFRDRRERESALGGADQDAIEAAVLQAQGVDLTALQEGMNAQGITVDSQVFDMRGSGLREEILGVVAAHGIDATQTGQQINASEDLQKDIMAVLERAGLNIDPTHFPRMPAPTEAPEPEALDPNVPQIRNPLDH